MFASRTKPINGSYEALWESSRYFSVRNRRKDTVAKTLYLFETKQFLELKQFWGCSDVKFAYMVLVS